MAISRRGAQRQADVQLDRTVVTVPLATGPWTLSVARRPGFATVHDPCVGEAGSACPWTDVVMLRLGAGTLDAALAGATPQTTPVSSRPAVNARFTRHRFAIRRTAPALQRDGNLEARDFTCGVEGQRTDLAGAAQVVAGHRDEVDIVGHTPHDHGRDVGAH